MRALLIVLVVVFGGTESDALSGKAGSGFQKRKVTDNKSVKRTYTGRPERLRQVLAKRAGGKTHAVIVFGTKKGERLIHPVRGNVTVAVENPKLDRPRVQEIRSLEPGGVLSQVEIVEEPFTPISPGTRPSFAALKHATSSPTPYVLEHIGRAMLEHLSPAEIGIMVTGYVEQSFRGQHSAGIRPHRESPDEIVLAEQIGDMKLFPESAKRALYKAFRQGQVPTGRTGQHAGSYAASAGEVVRYALSHGIEVNLPVLGRAYVHEEKQFAVRQRAEVKPTEAMQRVRSYFPGYVAD